jgi:YD repeat-containing protein
MRTFFNEPGPRLAKSRQTRRTVVACFWVVLLLAFLPACRNDGETTPKHCVLTEVRGFAGEVLERFAYNGDGRLVKYTLDGLSYQLQYNDAGQLTGVVESGINPDESVFEREFTLQYTNDGKTVVVKKPVEFTARPYEYTIELGEKGQLLRYTGDEDGHRIARRYAYDEAGNVTRSFFAQDQTEHLVYEQDQFDAKPSPYYTSASLRMFMQLVFGKAISPHNPSVTRHYDREGVLDWARTDVNAYNDRGYLVNQQGDFAGFTYAVSYMYNCP